MKKTLVILFAMTFTTYSSAAYSQLNLNIKIGQNIVKTVSANYGQDIIVSADGLKNKMVFNLRKFKNILVNGNKINPVQIDLKLVNDMKKIIGKPQTVTSFYNRTAQFNVGEGDLSVSVDFQEI